MGPKRFLYQKSATILVLWVPSYMCMEGKTFVPWTYICDASTTCIIESQRNNIYVIIESSLMQQLGSLTQWLGLYIQRLGFTEEKMAIQRNKSCLHAPL